MAQRLRCSLLCEDVEQEKFFRPILERLFGRVTVEPRRPGAAGGAPFVMARLADLVSKFRRKGREATGLVVVVDGDTFGLDSRIAEVDDVLQRHALTKLSASERIAVCVPCRNIETWELWLCGFEEIDETRDFKKLTSGNHAKKAAKAWFDVQGPERAKAERARVPALVHARKQIKRLEELAALSQR